MKPLRLVLTSVDSNEVQVFRAAVGKYGAGRYKGLTIGNEVCSTDHYQRAVEGLRLWKQVNDNPGLIAAKVADVQGRHSFSICVLVIDTTSTT